MNDTEPLTEQTGETRQTRCTAFEGQRCIGSGQLLDVAKKAKELIDRDEHAPILIFDEETSEVIEIDFRGTPEEVVQRLALSGRAGDASVGAPEKRGPGRPKLGVIGREVTLLPRHWEWLDGQPGGSSVALRKLVEQARRSNQGKDRARQAQESVYRFMSAMAGNLPDFEEALRAFYRKSNERLDELVQTWPADIRDHVRKLVAVARSNDTAA
jgi:hypothetical protein